MKTRVTWLLVLSASLVLTVPAAAGTLYDNGPINGTIDAWTINFGFILGNSFTISGGTSTVTGATFGAWLVPGDILASAEVSINDQPNLGGTTYFDQFVGFTAGSCSLNQYGFNVCAETANLNGPTLPNGTYWLTLQNAGVSGGDDPVYWDENDGVGCSSPGCPSQDWHNWEGTLPSESFTVIGYVNGSTPEPASLLLFGAGVVAVGGVVRRKFSR